MTSASSHPPPSECFLPSAYSLQYKPPSSPLSPKEIKKRWKSAPVIEREVLLQELLIKIGTTENSSKKLKFLTVKLYLQLPYDHQRDFSDYLCINNTELAKVFLAFMRTHRAGELARASLEKLSPETIEIQRLEDKISLRGPFQTLAI